MGVDLIFISIIIFFDVYYYNNPNIEENFQSFVEKIWFNNIGIFGNSNNYEPLILNNQELMICRVKQQIKH